MLESWINPQSDDQEDCEEIWEVVIAPTRAKYLLSKKQAEILKRAIGNGEKAVMFPEYTIFVAYICEFYLVKKISKSQVGIAALPDKVNIPATSEKWAKLREIVQRIKTKSDTV